MKLTQNNFYIQPKSSVSKLNDFKQIYYEKGTNIPRHKKTKSEDHNRLESLSFPNNQNAHRIFLWGSLLMNNYDKNIDILQEETEIISEILNLPNQETIKIDAERTRNTIFEEANKEYLVLLLTFYCKRNKINYKQGLNEVLAPFVYFRNANLTLSKIYNYFSVFLDKYLTNFFRDDEFIGLQICFHMFNLLLKYHDPYFCHFLFINGISTEIYAFPWFLTLFANKLNFDILYLLWDIYLLEDDPFFIFFICLSLLITNKNIIMSIDHSLLPQTLCNLKIHTTEELKKLYYKALDLRNNTPKSFFIKINEYGIFRKNYNNEKENLKLILDQVENQTCLYIKGIEIIQFLYPSSLPCIYSKCPKLKYMNSIEPNEESIEKAKINFNDDDILLLKNEWNGCRLCIKKNFEFPENITQHMNFIFDLKDIMDKKKEYFAFKNYNLNFLTFDLRKDKNFTGILPKCQMINTNLYTDVISDNLINDFIEIKGVYQFVFFISEGISLFNMGNSKAKNNYNDRFLTQPEENLEYDENFMLTKLSNDFIENGFSYVSILEGGYLEIHQLLKRYKLDILNHNIKKCNFCNRKNKKGSGNVNEILNKINQEENSHKFEIKKSEKLDENMFKTPNDNPDFFSFERKIIEKNKISLNNQNLFFEKKILEPPISPSFKINDKSLTIPNENSQIDEKIDNKIKKNLNFETNFSNNKIFIQTKEKYMTSSYFNPILVAKNLKIDKTPLNSKITSPSLNSQKKKITNKSNSEQKSINKIQNLSKKIIPEKKNIIIEKNDIDNKIIINNINTIQFLLKNNISRYLSYGVFQTLKINSFENEYLYETLSKIDFQYFICELIKEKKNEIQVFYINSQYKTTKMIILMTNFIWILLKHNEKLEKNLNLIKKGVFSTGSDILERTKILLNQNFAYNKKKNINLNQEKLMELNEPIKIKSFFLIKDLIKITSKKMNFNLISFYFKIIDLTKINNFESAQFMKIMAKFCLKDFLLLFNKNIENIFFDLKIENLEFIESKLIFDLINEEKSKDCIFWSKEYYSKLMEISSKKK